MRPPSPVSVSKWASAIASAMQSGRILPGELTVELLADEVARIVEEQHRLNPRLTPAFLVDGFPRSMDNVHHFARRFGPPLALLLLSASDATLRSRLQARAASSGRADDTREVMERRIAGFHAENHAGGGLVEEG